MLISNRMAGTRQMGRGRPIDFFVSYTTRDQAWAEWIAWVLEQAGYRTVIQAWDFRPGSNFVTQMNNAIISAQRTIAVLSNNYLNSGFAHAEWVAAFAKDPKGEKGLLIPIRIDDCRIEGLLKTIIYIDLVGLTEITAREILLRGLSSARNKPSPYPARAGCATAAGSRRTRWAPPGRVPVFS